MRLTQLLKEKHLRREALDIPEWNTTVYVRELTLKERDIMTSLTKQDMDKVHQNAVVASWVLVDADGSPEFEHNSQVKNSGVNLLLEQSGEVVDRIVNLCLRLSGLTGEKKDYQQTSDLSTG